jgi:hypothetical protein
VSRPWDCGVRWHLEQALADMPNHTHDPLTADFILEHHLRSADPAAEADYIEHLRRVSLEEAEKVTRRALLPQSFEMVLSAFPAYRLVLPKPPLQAVEWIRYRTDAGIVELSGGSPTAFTVVAPSGLHARKGWVEPLTDEVWPTTSTAPDAVRVRFQAGYPLGTGANAVAQIPEGITRARLVAIHEMHKIRSESVHVSQSSALRSARSHLLGYRVHEY